MATIDYIVIEADHADADRFYSTAFGLGERVRARVSDAPSNGFRGFTLSFVQPQPADVDGLIEDALQAGAVVLKPASKSLWGYGGVVRTPDGTICTFASSSKKNTRPATRQIDDVVLQLGVADVAESKRFYADRGFEVTASYGKRYVELGGPSSPLKLALYQRRALAKLARIPDDGDGSHRLSVGSDTGPFTDPDGFAWEAATG